ncbi:MAG: flagellar hook-length control protein FliK [Steroidobacteraceae bacterium]
MQANALTAPAPVGTTPVAPASTAASAAEGGDDFMGMLMQLLGGDASAEALPAEMTSADSDSDADSDEDPTALAAMLAMPVAVPLPWAAMPSAVSTENADPLELLGLASGAGKSDSDALLALKTDLAATLAEPAEVEETNESIGSLSPLSDMTSAKSVAVETPTSRLHAPVGTPQWSDELSAKVSWMVDRGQTSASLTLSPEHLGPLEVRISVTDDKASVWFGAAQADTRAAIENALPRLREMLATQGLSLGDAGVFREPPRDQSTPSHRSFGSGGESGTQEGEMVVSTRARSLLDAYA